MTVQADRPSFVLPRERDAATPPEARGSARDEVRLLVADSELTHVRFRELPDQLRPGDLVVVNNSATMSSAVDATLDGEPVVLHFSTWLDNGRWVVEVRTTQRTPYPAEGLVPGVVLRLPGAAATLCTPWLPGARRLWIADVTTDVPRLLAAHGRPITYSYVRHRWSASYYSTVFGRIPGSAEMPSAARPFTEHLVLDLIAAGIAFAPITLHTGVSSPESGEPPSPERFVVTASTAGLVNATRAAGGRIVAVGTTVTRALETVADPSGLVHAADGWTDLVLGADRPARVVEGLITGWHAPGASHLDLLVAVAGEETVAAAYAVAMDTGYLWHEFGDSALLFGVDRQLS
ncbi:S-adenosylmethionine:tRNA ribosyltransferase-isomerase [Nocardia sp. NBC_00508]|uniref:S-adenosylmethionine:tRNA ribosyltransferase-isomerase n=1 Tax=Nocardia sp. NBC_00508 TaxID=2975992 RepID=UPI002E80AE78|nr:S-adenosylmethionine:tRNA ribosyltransferase-isomerase [Nocardia sp. NBC_00508]WUD64824.1 S-adenosylmethionine:tRNA ribosyltransferase-isomerase [Nocardia sp. NBC_00508]